MRFAFGGREYEGRPGDTLAAALVRNGVRGGWRSLQLGRPRGVFAAGVEEPNAYVEVAGRPLQRATTLELYEGLEAEPRSGRARVSRRGHAGVHDKMHAHCDTLVVGAGPAGLAAARAAEGRVLLVEQGPVAAAPEGVRVLARTTAFGLFDGNLALASERGRRLWQIRAGRVVLATGALERSVVFDGNDRPGIMLAGAARTYVERFGAAPWRAAVVFATNEWGREVAAVLREAGVEVRAVVDRIAATLGEEALEAVVLTDGRVVECDLLCVSGGWNPVVHLWSQRGGRLRFDERTATFVPGGTLRGVEVVGAAAGELPETEALWVVPGDPATSFVDLERDVTRADVEGAHGAGLRSVEHVKRYTTVGTGSDQGKTSGVLAVGLQAQLLGVEPGELGTTSFRAPYTPVSFALLAGRNRGELSDPARVTPIHAWHVAHGAVFEDVGQWKRPFCFPRPGEDEAAAVRRECRAAREGVALMDVSTLGKIDVQGPDAVEFLNRLYTGTIDRVAVGSARYAVLCRSDGTVFDDGVVMRLADDRFLVTTTTGNAAPVLAWMEEWLQTEWPELAVRLTSVTDHWATVALVGPRARDVLGRLTELPLDAESFPWMAIRDTVVAGVDARLARVSFSGELAFEISVPGWYGIALWERLLAAGADLGITPYGTETMHVLRAEKGYVIVGQETDGTQSPQDLGLDWLVSKTKPDFVGRRSHLRAGVAPAARKQLVGLLPLDPEELLPEGAQLVAETGGGVPLPMLGHVTSSYRSAALGRTFALALLAGGLERLGDTVYAPLPQGVVAAQVTEPSFYDVAGARRDG